MIVPIIEHILSLWNNGSSSTLFVIIIGIFVNLVAYKITSKSVKKIRIYYKEQPDGIRIAIQNKSNQYLSNSDFLFNGKIIEFQNVGDIIRIDNTENLFDMKKSVKNKTVNLQYLRQKSAVIYKLNTLKMPFDKIITGHQKGFKYNIKIEKAFGLNIHWLLLKILIFLLGLLMLLLSLLLFLGFLGNLDMYLLYPSEYSFMNFFASIMCIFFQASLFILFLRKPLINSDRDIVNSCG